MHGEEIQVCKIEIIIIVISGQKLRSLDSLQSSVLVNWKGL